MPQDETNLLKSYYPEEAKPDEAPPTDEATKETPAPAEDADKTAETPPPAEEKPADEKAESERIYAALGEQFVSDPASAIERFLAVLPPAEAEAMRNAIMEKAGGPPAPAKVESKAVVDLKDYEPVTDMEKALLSEMDNITAIPELQKKYDEGFTKLETGVSQAHDQIGVLGAVAQASSLIVAGLLASTGVTLPELDFMAALKEAGAAGVAPADYIAEKWGPQIEAAFAETRKRPNAPVPSTPRTQSSTPSPPEPKKLEEIWAWAGDQVTKAS